MLWQRTANSGHEVCEFDVKVRMRAFKLIFNSLELIVPWDDSRVKFIGVSEEFDRYKYDFNERMQHSLNIANENKMNAFFFFI